MQDHVEPGRRNEFETLRRETIKAGAGFVLGFLVVYFLAFHWIWSEAENAFRFSMAMMMFITGVFCLQLPYFETIYRKAYRNGPEQTETEKLFSFRQWINPPDMTPGLVYCLFWCAAEVISIGIIVYIVFHASRYSTWKNQAEFLSLTAGNLFYFLFIIAMPKTIYRRGEQDRQKALEAGSLNQQTGGLSQRIGIDNKWSRISVRFSLVSNMIFWLVAIPLFFGISRHFIYLPVVLLLSSYAVLNHMAYQDGVRYVLEEKNIAAKPGFWLYTKTILFNLTWIIIYGTCIGGGYILNTRLLHLDLKGMDITFIFYLGIMMMATVPYQYERGMKEARARYKESDRQPAGAGTGLA